MAKRLAQQLRTGPASVRSCRRLWHYIIAKRCANPYCNKGGKVHVH